MAVKDYPDVVVSISDSQLMRFIDELNGVSDSEQEIRVLQNKIRLEKRKPKSRKTKIAIRNLYDRLYSFQFKKDYICVVMNSKKDYDRANKGFTVNGIHYRRFLGTNGGIKNSTIVYVNSDLYPELKRRMDNGRNQDVPLVPAKLEAYQALICSGSVPVPEPEGIIVVNDCITHFRENVIMLDDEKEDEPVMSYFEDYKLENNDSDGYGLMLPSYAKKVNAFLNGINVEDAEPLSGMNTRYAWNKGMLIPFDFIEFAETVSGRHVIKDVWGDYRDVRNAEVILTESMLKLWNCYDSWEDYYRNCKENHYEFSVTKVCPDELEGVRNTNYQFLQSYDLTDDEIQELCQPSIDEIKEVIGMDYRKSLAFLCGFGLNEDNIFSSGLDSCVRSLMVKPELINDSFIRRKIWNMIAKRIQMCKRGAIRINANFAIITGDPYALCQSMFRMEITGLLKAGEMYHKYWIDNNTDEVVCFRAPMTGHNNIVKLKLNKESEPAYWYRYIKTAIVLNAWDSTRNSLNGADCDGDLFMTTDNPVLLKNTLYTPTIICIQRKAEKKTVTEEDIVEANKLGFTDEIGIVTNHITSMFEVRAGFHPDSEEYKTLSYRIMCGQLFQQNVIDQIKGIVSKPMPSYWYNLRDNIIRSDDNKQDAEKKIFNQKIAAYRKPYFMIYVYSDLQAKNNKYTKNTDNGALMRFCHYGIKNVNDLIDYEPKTEEMTECLKRYDPPVGTNVCTINRICWLFEKEFNGYLSKKSKPPDFDYSVLKCGVEYSQNVYSEIFNLYEEYKMRMHNFRKKQKSEHMDSFEITQQKALIVLDFRRQCETICTNEDELCDILADICYKNDSAKQFFWDIAGETAFSNLLKQNNNCISFPVVVKDGGEFTYCDLQFVMHTVQIDYRGDGFT